MPDISNPLPCGFSSRGSHVGYFKNALDNYHREAALRPAASLWLEDGEDVTA